MRPRFTAWSFLGRWLAAVLLVLGTYNPTGWSFVHWALQGEGDLPVKALVGLLLLVGYVIYLRATWTSIGLPGMVLTAALLAALVWCAAYYGLLDLRQPGVASYLLLFVIATVMGVGLSWSHVRRRLSGQADVDDGDA